MFDDLFSVILVIACYPALILLLVKMLENFRIVSRHKELMESAFNVILVPLRGVYELIPEVLSIMGPHVQDPTILNKIDSYRQKGIKYSNSISLKYDLRILKALDTAHQEMEKCLISLLNEIEIEDVTGLDRSRFANVASLFLELNERRQRLSMAVEEYNNRAQDFKDDKKKFLNLLCVIALGLPSYEEIQMGILKLKSDSEN